MPNLYDNIKYSRSFLSQVIFRIDFAAPLENEVVFHPQIISVIEELFPKSSMQRLIRFGGIEVQVDANGVHNRISPNGEGKELTYSDITGKNKVIISNLAIVFEYNNYSTYEDMFTAIRSVITELWGQNAIMTSRIGMRYVNLYNQTDTMPKVTKSMFATSMWGALNQHPQKCNEEIEPIRTMTTTEYKRGDMRINCRYGIFNRAYPAKMTRDDFVIDIDCFISTGIDSTQDILGFMNSAHESMQELFETAITDKMRAIMNG